MFLAKGVKLKKGLRVLASIACVAIAPTQVTGASAIVLRDNPITAPAAAVVATTAGIPDTVYCSTCSQVFVYYNTDGSECTLSNLDDCAYRYMYHYFDNDICGTPGGGEDQLVSNPTRLRETVVRKVTRVAEVDGTGDIEEEETSYCARCNGTSTCHPPWAASFGKCHLRCNGGTEQATNNAKMQDLLRAIRIADAATVRSLLGDPGTPFHFNRERRSIQIALRCKPELIGTNLELGEAIAGRLAQLLGE